MLTLSLLCLHSQCSGGIQSSLKLGSLLFLKNGVIPTLPCISVNISLEDRFKRPAFLNSTLHVVVNRISTQFLRGLDTPEKGGGSRYFKGLLEEEHIVQKWKLVFCFCFLSALLRSYQKSCPEWYLDDCANQLFSATLAIDRYVSSEVTQKKKERGSETGSSQHDLAPITNPL